MEHINPLSQPKPVTPRTAEVEITVRPLQSLMDERININVKGLVAGQPITVKANLTGDSNERFESYGQFTADDAGTVCIAEHYCQGGTYTGSDAMGLLWSMQFAPGQKKGQRLSKKDPTKPYYIQLQVFDGHAAVFHNTEAKQMASTTFEKWYMAPGVRRIPVRDGRVRGTLFIPPGKGPFPGISANFKYCIVPWQFPLCWLRGSSDTDLISIKGYFFLILIEYILV